MELVVRCRTDAKRLPLPEIAFLGSYSNKLNADEDTLPLHLQETGIEVAGVSEFERGLVVIANRKKEEEIRKRKKENDLFEAQENQGRDTIKKQKGNKTGKGVRVGKRSKP